MARQVAGLRAEPYLSTDEAAKRLRAKRQRVHDLCSAGTLTRVQDGTRVLIECAELEAYLRGKPTGPGRWRPRTGG